MKTASKLVKYPHFTLPIYSNSPYVISAFRDNLSFDKMGGPTISRLPIFAGCQKK
jgi:hypothetical protein